LPKKNFRRGLFPAPCELPQFGSQRIKGGLNFIEESLAEDFSMFGLGRAAVPRRATLQTSDQIFIQVAHMQISSHPGLHEIIDLNDLKGREASQEPVWCGRRNNLYDSRLM
jgi:hypothetical protein